MTLIFSNNDYKYELEGVLKLFIPATKFNYLYADSFDVDDDFIFSRAVEYKNYDLLYIIAKYDNKYYHKAKILNRDCDLISFDKEFYLSRILYKLLVEIMGIVPKWGVITGIRPVKRVNTWLNEGLTKNQVYKKLSEEYLVSDDKCKIAYLTALAQKDVLNGLNDRSFSLYVSIPFCPTRCTYCSFISQTVDSGRKLLPKYLENLCTEIECTAQLSKDLGLKLDTVYFGGGTPTSVSAQQLEMLMKCIEHSFDMSSVREYTVEAGRPDTVTEEKLRTIKACGATRISINPQTLNERALEAIGRKHTPKQFFEAFELARRVGFNCINTDIIAGLPEDTPDSFAHTVEELIKLDPENITVHTLSIKRAALLNKGDKAVLNNPTDTMVEYATNRLMGSGFQPYYLYRQKNMVGNLENIGWAKKGFESLYNIYIMEEVQTILAVGAGASTKLVNRAGRIERVFNYKFPLEYNNHFDLMLERKNEIKSFYENA